MKLIDLHLKNIGPFLDESIEFATSENSKSQVTIFTGENGTGKTVILDAIRKIILDGINSRTVIRSINSKKDFELNLNILIDNIKCNFISNSLEDEKFLKVDRYKGKDKLSRLFGDCINDTDNGDIWITNYWTSQNDNQSFKINQLDPIDLEDYLLDSLNGIQKNAETTKIITYFDYYKSSDKPEEKQEGEFIFQTIKQIFKISLNEGELKYIDRSSLLPIININGNEISLEKLSSGNLYLVQRMLGLLSQMYSVYKLNNLALEDMLKTPGVLLIDEAENHLHPKWQKTFLNSILAIFPNLQIIATTHSPFIVGSVDGAKVYVCKSQDNHSIIEDETSEYSNKPIDEILMSEVFGGTSPFANEKIVELLEERKKAIKSRDKKLENKIEDALKQINPQYFSYLELDNLLKSISK